MPILERPGATVAYDVQGDGPALLLGHSLLCDRRMWAGVTPRLAEHYRVFNIEFRGHGESRSDGPFTFDDLVEDWRALLDHEGIDRAALCGLSMGGMTGMRLAERAPERVGALVLIDSAGSRETWPRRLKYRILTALYRRMGFSDRLLGRIAPIMFGATTMAGRPELIEAFAEQARGHDREQLIGAIRAVNGRSDASGLDRISAPTLVVVGEQDIATPPDRSEFLARAIPDATLVRIADAGHLAAMEQPAAVADAVLEFLAQQSWD